MKHCQSTIFHGDNFCADCGEALSSVPNKNNVEDVCPDIFDDVRQYYKEAEAKTGQVLESRLYKRFSKSSSQNLEYSYWWIKLETNRGEIIETSISAEHRYTASIGRGDILTLYYPTTINLLYKKSRDAKKFVKDDQAVPCVVVHGDDGQSYTVEDIYPSPNKTTAWLWIVAGILSAIPLLNGSHPASEAAWVVSITVALIVLFLELKRNRKKFAFATAKYEALNASFNKLLKIPKHQLGYNNIERPKQSSDVICIQCNMRLPKNTEYCICCGKQSTVQVPPALTAQYASSAEFGAIGSLEPTLEARATNQDGAQREHINATSAPTSVSVSDIQRRLDEKYSYHSQGQYTHHYVLSSARHWTITNEFILARVQSKSVNTDISDITRHTTTTTETKHYRGSSYQYSTYDTRHSSYRNRSSTLKGTVILEYVSGQMESFTLPEDILGDVDVGDWLAIADSYLEREDNYYYYFEYAYNISKDKEYNARSFVNYSDVKGTNAWWGWNILFFVASIVGIFTNSAVLLSVGVIGAILFNVFALCKRITSSSKNKRQRKIILKPLQAKVYEFKESLPQLKKQLNVLG